MSAEPCPPEKKAPVRAPKRAARKGTCDACLRPLSGYWIYCEECDAKMERTRFRVAELEPLATFGRAVLRVWRNDGDPGDLDGTGVQGMAEAAGLWRAVQEGEHGEDCEECGGAGGPCGELTDAGVAAVREEVKG